MFGLNLSDADTVRELLVSAAEACRTAACRKGAIEVIRAPGTLIATGDLHDNPLHLKRLVHEFAERHKEDSPSHLTLHEIVHPPRLINGMDFSFRALTRVAAMKKEWPERIHVLLGNHELAQATGAEIIKDGIKPVAAFMAGLEHAYSDKADRVMQAVREFVFALPVALLAECDGPDGTPGGRHILCSHSLPTPGAMGKFDTTILHRELVPDDYLPRTGSAYMIVWGRGYDAELLEDLVERWGVNLFILGHEKADSGVRFVPPNALVLASDHEHGVFLPVDLRNPPKAGEAVGMVVPLGGDES